MNFKQMASDAGIDIEDFIEIAHLLIDTSMDDLKKIKQAMASNNLEGVSQAAHSIKGASGNLGLTEISDTAAQIEKNAKSGLADEIPAKADLIAQHLRRLENSISTFNDF